MQDDPTNEAANTTPIIPPGKNDEGARQDPDDLVHQQPGKDTNITGEEDMDQLVHENAPGPAAIPGQEIDPDDIVHHSSEPDEDLEVGGEG